LCAAVSSLTVTITVAPNQTNLFVLFRATDNVGVVRDAMVVRFTTGAGPTTIDPSTIEAVDGTPHACLGLGGQSYPAGSFVVTIPMAGWPTFSFDITASDAGGRSHRVTFNLIVTTT
ncbi:MAG: hypothetical protein ACT4OI_10570, partial [Methanobacteriota archaeon]